MDQEKCLHAQKPNYAFNPIAEQALRPNQTIVPQRVNAALALMWEPAMILTRFVAIGLFLVYGFPLFACSIHPKPTDEQLYERASSIFIAQLVETKLKVASPEKCDDAEHCEYVEGKYRLIEAIKGKPSKSGRVIDAVYGPGTCSVGLITGWYYVFYTGKDRGVYFPSGSYSLGPWPEDQDFKDARKISEPGHVRIMREA